METKILVASPTFSGMRYCQDRFIDAIKDLDYPGYDILIVDNSKEKDYYKELSGISGIRVLHDETSEEKSIFRLISSRNLILQYALDNGYSHVLMLDSDVIPQKDIIQELLRCDKDIVSGIYNNYFNISGERKLLPVVWKYLTEEEFEELKLNYPNLSQYQKREDVKRHITDEEMDSGELQEVAIPSAGCMLLSRRAFEKTRYGKFKEHGSDDDIFFIEEARKQGIFPYCYPKVRCEHLIGEKYKKDEKGNYVHQSFKDIA